MGLLDKEDWLSAKWIAYEELADSNKIIPHVALNGKKHGEKDQIFCP